MQPTFINDTGNQQPLIILCIFYAISCLTSAVAATRLIELGPFLLPGGIFIFPFSYAIIDIVAELYGYQLANKLILILSIGSIIYALYIFTILHAPYPLNWTLNNSYQKVLDGSLRITFWGVLANYLGSIFNAFILIKLKLILRWKFPLRSIVASSVGEMVLTVLVYTGLMFGNAPATTIIHLAVSGYIVKLSFAILLAFPSQFIIAYLKRTKNLSVLINPSTFNLVDKKC